MLKNVQQLKDLLDKENAKIAQLGKQLLLIKIHVSYNSLINQLDAKKEKSLLVASVLDVQDIRCQTFWKLNVSLHTVTH